MQQQYSFLAQPRNIESWAYWDDCFNEEELNYIQSITKKAENPAYVGTEGRGVVDESIRRSRVAWLQYTPEHEWVYKKLDSVVNTLNNQFFGFNLTSFSEAFQLTNYLSEESGNYDWHIDMGRNEPRKLSLVLQLSDPADYDGGELLLKVSSMDIAIPKKRGLIAVFPSWTLHTVTPVTRGNRQTLVSWVLGPQFI